MDSQLHRLLQICTYFPLHEREKLIEYVVDRVAHFAASMASMASVNIFEQVGGADNPCGAQKFFHSHEVLWYRLDAF